MYFRKMAAMLAAVYALSPLAIDMYLPTFSAIAGDLSVSTQDIAVTISIYILGFSLGQFVGGPLSDYRGRRPVMLTGLTIFFLASIALAVTDDIGFFWGLRFVQAIGGGLATVVVPALIRDYTEGQESAKLLTLIGLITVIAPAIAPAVGTLLFTLSGWRAIFFALAGYAALVIVLMWNRLRLVAAPRAGAASQSLAARYRFVLSNTVAMRYLLAQGLVFGVMMTFLANASLIYIERYGVSEGVFSALFAANVGAMALFNRLNHFLLNRLPAARIVVPAIALQGVASLALLIVTGFGPPLWVVVPVIMLIVGSLGCIMGNAQACLLQFFPHHSGIASSLMGSGLFLIAAVVSAISTQFHSDLMWPMSVTMSVAALLALLIVPSAHTWERHAEKPAL